jgi:uroporphyrinogen-III decarboxylase
MNNLERFKKTLNWEPVDRIMTYDYLDNKKILVEHGGYDDNRVYSFEELVELNARAWKNIGVDVTRSVYDPVNHWMGEKIKDWIRFFRVDPDGWDVSQAGDTAWISKRPFRTLAELEKHMPQLPVYEEVREWYQPFLRMIQQAHQQQDVVFIGAVEGPISDAYIYMDMELFAQAIYDAPELVAHIMDCTGMFSAHIARAYAEVSDVPLMFMGEDISGTTGPIFNPKFVRQQGLPRWNWIRDPIKAKAMQFLFHTDGRYGKFLPLILEEFGADGLNPIERNNCNDIFAIREAYPHKLLFGNVCCLHTLPHGTPADVEDETLELIEKIGPGGGIFIGSSSEVHEAVPVENAVRMYATVHEYGSYPIDVDRIRARRLTLRKKGLLHLRAAQAD